MSIFVWGRANDGTRRFDFEISLRRLQRLSAALLQQTSVKPSLEMCILRLSE